MHIHIYIYTFDSGGVELIFNGNNLNVYVVENPMLEVSDPEYLNVTNISSKTKR